MKVKANKTTIIAAIVALIIGLAGGFGLGRIGTVKESSFWIVADKYEELKATNQSNDTNDTGDTNNSDAPVNSAIEHTTHTNSGYSAEWADDGTAFEVEGTYAKAEIKDVYLEKSGSFGYVLTINFVYTNNSDEAHNFINDAEVSVHAFQKGVELDNPGWTSENGVFDTNNSYTRIKQGATIETQLAFIIPDPAEPVEVEIGPWGHSDKIITKTINFTKN